MKAWEVSARRIAQILVVCCGPAIGAGSAVAQTVTVSPTDLSFGVPTGTNPAVSAAQTVTVNIAGSSESSVTFSGVTASAPDFAITGNSCTGTIKAPNACQVSVTFTAHPPSTALETATLTIVSNATPGTLTVPMNGAYGAIELFAALNINPSLFPGVTWPNSPGNPVKTANPTLSCPPSPTAKLSSTPDGLSNVFQDNTIQFSKTVNSATATTTNVCTGGDPNFLGFTGFPPGTTNCFQQPYEGAASGYLGQNPDLATAPNPGGAPGSFVATFGVPPIDVSGLLTPGTPSANQTQSLAVQLVDAGGDLGAATVHLVTNCTLAGVTPGGSITGNPITPGDTSSQTQTFAFDNGGGQNISFITSVSTAQQAGTVNIPPGTIPIVTNVGVPQQLFSQLVAGKSAAPAVCLRLTGETDSFGNAMCKGYLIQCQNPNNGTISGDNCVPTASTARNLFDEAQFDSPDAPKGTNFLSSACSSFTNGGTCATSNPNGATPMLIGPGLLLGSDNWLCANGQMTPCTPLEPDTHTTGTVYSAGNCSLTGTLTGDTCPLDTLTQFRGAADPTVGSTTNGRNSLFIPVVNMPLPFTQTTMLGRNMNGWINASNPTANTTFVSNAANYVAATNNPPGNSFTQAPPYSLTYGVAPSTDPIPDTTFPVKTDTSVFNTGTKPNLGTPLCPGGPPASFTTNVALNPGKGIFNLHYFTTDCAFTEELLFNPTANQLTDPTANWASFRTLAFGVDTVAPTLSCSTSPATPNGTNSWYTSNVTANCSASDDFSGFAPGSPVDNTNGAVLQGSTTESLAPVTTGVSPGTANPSAQIPQQQVTDLAGNASNVQGPFSTPIDLAFPTISGTFSVSGTNFTVGQNVTLQYTCADVGSGLASCGGQVVPTACPMAPNAGAPSFTTTAVAIDTSAGAAGPHMINTTATDCAGNIKPFQLNYTVSFGPADLLVATLARRNVDSGSNLTYAITTLNLGPATAYNVTVTTSVPSGTTFVSATSDTVTCTFFGCSEVASGKPCALSSGVVTCSVPTLKTLFNLTGFVVKLVVKVTAEEGSTIKDIATVKASNPDPRLGNNTFTALTSVTD